MPIEKVIARSKTVISPDMKMGPGGTQQFPITFLKDMELDGVYVPPEVLEDSINEWEGTPITLNHPIDSNGEFTMFGNSSDESVGEITNPRIREVAGETFVDATAEVDINKLHGQGEEGIAASRMLESGSSMDVSSGFLYGRDSGIHNGEMHKFASFIEPDHVALLPNAEGKCSQRDGCSINTKMSCNCDHCTNDDDSDVRINKKKARQKLINSVDTEWSNSDTRELLQLSRGRLRLELSKADISVNEVASDLSNVSLNVNEESNDDEAYYMNYKAYMQSKGD